MGRVNVSGFGNLSIASDAKAPLLVVFGGKKVGTESGVYMWNFMGKIQSRYHIFVAVNQHVNGKDSYDALLSTVDAQNLTPSRQFLHLFSGGWLPGEHLLGDMLRHKKSIPFERIYLVDIWMGSSTSADFYTHLPNKISTPITYVHTLHGAVDDDARDALARSVGSQNEKLVKPEKTDKDSMDTHMRTNTVAVGLLP